MNFDVNTLASLMQAIKPSSNGAKDDIPQQKRQSEQSSAKSPFCAQNGLGEQIRWDTDESGGEKKNAFADIMGNLAKQNPMFSLVGAMQGGKGDMSSLLPVIMSLMQPKSPKSEEKTARRSKTMPTLPKNARKAVPNKQSFQKNAEIIIRKTSKQKKKKRNVTFLRPLRLQVMKFCPNCAL